MLTQSSLVDCNACQTPALTTNLGLDLDGDPYFEDWEYASIVGMLMYLANNPHPDITFAVHQCARFTHSTKQSHENAVKKIIRYLKGTSQHGMTLTPTKEMTVDCYVDADFAGLFEIEDDQDPICVKSQTGYLITFMSCPLLWVSKLQTQIALSTMEAKYIAISHSMQDLIAIRGMLQELMKYTFAGSLKEPTLSTHSKSFLQPSNVYKDNSAAQKLATLPKISPQTKHIGVPYHHFRTEMVRGNIKALHIGTDKQLADQFTKGLPYAKFTILRKQLLGW